MTITPTPFAVPKLKMAISPGKIFGNIFHNFAGAIPPIPEWVFWLIGAVPVFLILLMSVFLYRNFYKGEAVKK
jgi:hypothetical protein